MTHSCGIGEIPPPIRLTQSFNIEDAVREKDRFETQLKTYNDLLEIQNEQLRTRDDELKRLREELHNVVQTRELERQTTTTQDSFTYLLLQRENNKLADKVKSLEELYEKVTSRYDAQIKELEAEYERQILEYQGLQPPKLVRQIAYTAEEGVDKVPPLDLSEENITAKIADESCAFNAKVIQNKIADNTTKINKLKKKSLLKRKQENLTEKLRRMSAGKPAHVQ